MLGLSRKLSQANKLLVKVKMKLVLHFPRLDKGSTSSSFQA